ncbi:tetratricopeptide repeat protein [Leptothermofonsia sichuanensis E412]|uniref:tetratricopeptide repeat protein n=1 Tax=Leptothermofonsia sichuanensis TaxID=2917832 RepID=UPI001CA63B11|nr:tetratricopeptide repeat protein [Leptothermofonsia sichuanensis]QZZ21283.1 tetratricopeptide repeat protein [Leptothermofonsia sichuanensis E412]
MLDQVTAAFERQDYQTAAHLLKQLLKEMPHDPWVQFYTARLQEVAGKLDTAEETYRQLLRNATSSKLATQSRQGIQRIEAMRQERRQQAIAQTGQDPASNEPGFMVLEAVAGDARTIAVQNFARVMKLDAYTARMLLPSRGWRLYRSNTVGELQVYGQELREAGVPVFWASLAQLQKIQVFQVHYFQSISPRVNVVCRNQYDQVGTLTFDWAEIRQRVEGMIPVFEQVLTLGYRDRLERKEATQDYSHFCDLHLPGRRCILRLQDTQYEFHQGISVVPRQGTVDPLDRNTIRTNWNHLLELLNQQLCDQPVWTDFTAFAETASDFAIPLRRLKSHIHLLRYSESHWDTAFQLYSGMIFLRHP